MFCPNCGSQNPDNANNCGNCGARLNNANQYQQYNSTYQTSTINTAGITATDASRFRGLAREKLAGKWGTAAILMLIFGLCSFGISFVINLITCGFGSPLYAIITPVLSFGLLVQWIKLKNGENIGYFDFFSIGFNNFANVWKVQLRVILKFIVPIIIYFGSFLLIFVGMFLATLDENMAIVGVLVCIIASIASIVASILLIPISYKYMFCLNELAYDSNRSSKDIVEYSGNLMVGKRVGAFWLNLTFIGWVFLAGLGCGIPLLWITPYMQIASIIYYEWASNRLN